MADMTVANEIARQMGGTGRLKSFTGARDFVGGPDYFMFRWTAKSKNKANKVKITLQDAYKTSTYDQDKIMSPEDTIATFRSRLQSARLDILDHTVRIEYYERIGKARIWVWWEKAAGEVYPQWKGEYWDNRTLNGAPALVRNDRHLEFYWGDNAPASGLPAAS